MINQSRALEPIITLIKMNYILIVFIGIVGIFYYNTLDWLIKSWMYDEYYSYGFMIPIISGYFFWNMRKDLASMEKKPSQIGLALFVGGVVLQGISVLLIIRFLSGISLLLTLAGVIIYVCGWEFMNKIKFPFLFLLLMIPLPFVDMLASSAQTVSVSATANVANLIGMPVQMEGDVLRISQTSFEVALPCSGINSILSLFTIGVIFSFILEGSNLMKVIIPTSTVPLAVAGNILRITSILAVASKYGEKAAIDYFHDFSSILLFSVALIGLFCVGRCFGRLRFKKIF